MKEAIVLLNMGGPNNLREVEMFLTNMFNDPAIIRTKSTLMRRFIAGIITLSRAEKSQEIYRKIGGKSPIVELTKELIQELKLAINNDFKSLLKTKIKSQRKIKKPTAPVSERIRR